MAEDLGHALARALADRDAGALKLLLRPDVEFRAMTPGMFWEASDADTLVDEIMLGTWFDDDDRITRIVHVDTGVIGSRHRVGYRFELSGDGGDQVIEQQAYYETDGQRISWLRVMCSGFLPAEA